MSVEAITWAFKVRTKSGLKLLLLALADYANENNFVWPSLAALEEKTCQDRKTIISSLQKLEELGFLVDTGERTGRTGQIKVYRLNTKNSTENGTVKASQKRNSTKNGTVPNFPPKSTVFPNKEYRFSHETVPKTEPVTLKEPLKEPLREPLESAREPEPPEKQTRKRKTSLPENWFLPKDWGDWALDQGLTADEIRTEAECFADYWRSKGETRLDWLATWRNWIRRKRTFDRKPIQQKKTIFEQNMEASERAKKLIFGDVA